MADQAHLTLILQDIQQWNEWRQQRSYIVPDLSGADLNHANLSNADLRYANLYDTNFYHADLSHANLYNANLSHANLYQANLFGAHLFGADLFGANLSNADLSHASLSNANLFGTNLSNANLFAANLNEAGIGWTQIGDRDLRMIKGLETVKHHGPSPLSINTVYQSAGDIPEAFVKGTGAPGSFIEYMHMLTAKPFPYFTCFISYASQDELFVRQLHNDLQQEDVCCWFAPKDTEVSDAIKKRIDDFIRLYDKLLLIISEHSIASNWIAYEVEHALEKETPEIPNVLYPIRLDNALSSCPEKWLKDIQETRHISNFEHWTTPQRYQDSLQRLSHRLRNKTTTRRNPLS